MRRPPGSALRRWRVGALAATLGLAAAWGSVAACGSAADRRAVLSFFFDGVDEEEARREPPRTPTPVDIRAPDGRPAPKLSGSQHAPFLNRACDICHAGARTGGRAVRGPELCLDCHDMSDYRDVVTHAPLESEGCILCHNPHESSQPHLVRRPERELCGRCHDTSDVQFTSWHARIPEAERCTRCHDPHGAPGRQLLLPLDAGRCATCHPDQLRDHAPINAGQCGPCHSGDHQGPPPYLTDEPEALCGACHDIDRLSGGGLHLPGQGRCTGCHDPHRPSPAMRSDLPAGLTPDGRPHHDPSEGHGQR